MPRRPEFWASPPGPIPILAANNGGAGPGKQPGPLKCERQPGERLLPRGEHLPAPPCAAGEDVTIARLRYGGGGDWYCDPGSLANWLAEFERRNLSHVVSQIFLHH